MSKMVFIEPKAQNVHIFTKFPLPRLGSFVLGTLMKKRGWDVQIIIEQLDKIDYNKLKTVDLVGISTITPTAPRAYAIADLQRAQMISHDRFYSVSQSIIQFFRCWRDMGLAHYARGIYRFWKKQNSVFLKTFDLLTPGKKAAIRLDYREQIYL